MKWYPYTRGSVKLNRLSAGLLAAHTLSTRLNGVSFDNVFYFNTKDKLYWAWSDREVKNLGKKIIEKCSIERRKNQHFEKFKEYYKKALSASEKIRRKSLKKLTSREIIKEYDYLLQESFPVQALLNADIDAIDIVFEEFLQKELKRELKNNISQGEFLNLYKKISIPLYDSFVILQEKAIIKVALKNKFSKDDIEKIYNKFWWTKMGWENLTPYKKEYFENQVRNYKKDRNLNKKLKEIEIKIDRTKKERYRLLKKYHLSKKTKYWLEVMDKYSKYHDWRKEMQVKVNYSLYLLTLKVARRLKLKIDDLEWLWFEEIKRLLKGDKLDKNEVNKRKKALCIIVSKKGIRTWSGDKAIKKFKKEWQEEQKSVREFRGMGVSSGRIIAGVKVCNGSKEALEKIKKGDILVTGMTVPDFVPAMKKALAVITDEGGITCHAAIISRELGIPCVVGTKIATQVLKDGDLVEVDAEKGIIKVM